MKFCKQRRPLTHREMMEKAKRLLVPDDLLCAECGAQGKKVNLSIHSEQLGNDIVRWTECPECGNVED